MVSRWRIFQKPIESTPERIEKIVLATVAVHDYFNQTDKAHYTPAGFIDSEIVLVRLLQDNGERISPTTFKKFVLLETQNVKAMHQKFQKLWLSILFLKVVSFQGNGTIYAELAENSIFILVLNFICSC